MKTELVVNPAKVAMALVAIVVLLTVLHLLSIYMQINLDFGERARGRLLRKLVNLFDFDAEQNIPSFYAATAILVAAAIAFAISRMERLRASGHFYHWLGISFLLAFMALEETVSIHEMFDEPVKTFLNIRDGYLAYSWIIPYAGLVLVVAAVYLRFLLSMPRRTQILFVSAAAIYVAGAIGGESIGGKIFYEQLNHTNMPYIIVHTLEELMEKLGVILAIYAMLDYAKNTFLPINLAVRGDAGAKA